MTPDYIGVVIGGLIGIGGTVGLWLFQQRVANERTIQQLIALLKDTEFVFSRIEQTPSANFVPNLLDDQVALLKQRCFSSEAAMAVNAEKAKVLNAGVLRASRSATTIIVASRELNTGGRNTAPTIEAEAKATVELLNKARKALGDLSPL